MRKLSARLRDHADVRFIESTCASDSAMSVVHPIHRDTPDLD